MEFRTLFFSGLSSIEIPQLSTRGDRFLDKYYITNDTKRISELVEPYKSEIGNVEYEDLTKRSSALIYRHGKLDTDRSALDAEAFEELRNDMIAAQMLLFSLWLIKDNAAHQDTGWLAVEANKPLGLLRNTWDVRQSKSDGSLDTVQFNAHELKEARGLATEGSHLSGSREPTMLASTSMRYQRFTYFVQAARATSDVALKLAQYCTALEALVSTSHSELSHQVSERVAALLENPGEQRIEAYALLKQAYGYRSKTVHGATFKEKVYDRMRACSGMIDEVCRHLSKLYLNSDNGVATALENSDEKIAEFFLDRILGNTT
jgi:hypothetical protein